MALASMLGLVALYFGGWCLLLIQCLQTPLRIVLFIPAVSYRIILKATAVTYAPLLWVMVAPSKSSCKPAIEINRALDHPLAILGRYMAAVAFVVLGIRIAIMVLKNEWIARFTDHEFAKILPYDLATLLNIIGTIGMWYCAKGTLWRLKNGVECRLDVRAATVRTLRRARNVLSVYTTICNLYFLPHYAYHVRWPKIEWLFFPW